MHRGMHAWWHAWWQAYRGRAQGTRPRPPPHPRAAPVGVAPEESRGRRELGASAAKAVECHARRCLDPCIRHLEHLLAKGCGVYGRRSDLGLLPQGESVRLGEPRTGIRPAKGRELPKQRRVVSCLRSRKGSLKSQTTKECVANVLLTTAIRTLTIRTFTTQNHSTENF
jgi:hypothetical protein